MKIIELNQEQFSLKNITIKFEQLNQDEHIFLSRVLKRVSSKVFLDLKSLLIFLDIDELRNLLPFFKIEEQRRQLELIIQRHQLIWSSERFRFDLTSSAIVYSIVNVTPDSFYDGSVDHLQVDYILKRVESDLENGAAVIELGGKSSRPGYADISPEEEWLRLEKPLKAIKQHFPQAIVAIDTDEALVMERTLDLGADIINDIDGFDTHEKLEVIQNYRPAVVAMNNGRAGFNFADNVFDELPLFFEEKAKELRAIGLKNEQICIDPGVGFFKGDSGLDSVQRLKATERLTHLGLPVMVAISRKSFMESIFNVVSKDRLFSTLMLEAQMILDGGRILRVHDVKETKVLIDAVKRYKEI